MKVRRNIELYLVFSLELVVFYDVCFDDTSKHDHRHLKHTFLFRNSLFFKNNLIKRLRYNRNGASGA